tara:strand:- start:257 stop:520 length:264 start_codon:yes stop_codon:yes gene_type:complete
LDLALGFLTKTILNIIFGSLLEASLFLIITNFGVWTLDSYIYTFEGLLLCYTLAIALFAYTLISTFIFTEVIEGVYKFSLLKLKTSK